jgi:hypothetical protein
MDSSVAVSTNTWHHIAIVRNGNVWTLYLDGTAAESTTVSGTLSAATGHFSIGGDYYDTTYPFRGYVDEIRVSNIARWTSNFTPATAAYVSD